MLLFLLPDGVHCKLVHFNPAFALFLPAATHLATSQATQPESEPHLSPTSNEVFDTHIDHVQLPDTLAFPHATTVESNFLREYTPGT